MDTGSHHLVNGGIQGLVDTGYNSTITRSKVLLILGSSHNKAVAYEGNNFIQANLEKSCGLTNPCGAHAYKGQGISKKEVYVSADVLKDKSVCLVPDFTQSDSSACMRSISAQEITEKVLEMIK